jgi:pectin methylesterase-like acyl-CoA thioesterase
MKTKITILFASLLITLNLFAGAITINEASGASVTQMQNDMSNAVSAGNTDITLQFADGGVYGSSASDVTIAVPAGVTKLTFYAPSTVTTKPILYLNTITYSDALMADGLIFDGVKVMTSIANRYLIQPTSDATKFPAKITIKNCWIEGYRAVLYSSLATTTSEVVFTNNIFKNITNSGIISVSAGTIPIIKIRNNTFINVGGNASGATTDYFVDFRSANSVTSQINFSNNTIYYPAVQGRGLFRFSGNFTTGYLKENNNLYSTGNSTSFALQLLYSSYSVGTTDADSTNYYSNKMTLGSNKGTITTTMYTEKSPSILFFNPAADDFTINDPDFAGKNTAGDPRWFPKEVTTPVTLSTSVSPANAGTVTPSSATVNSGSSLTVTATNEFGYSFKEWRDGNTNELLSTDNPYTFTITSNTSLVAVYETLTTYDFTVNIAGSKWGTVTLSPAPTNGKYVAGTVVSMTAVNDSVSTFLNWEDETTQKSRSIIVDGDKTFTATFSEKSFIVGWDLVTAEPKSSRPADYYSVSSNKGTFSAYEPNGTAVSWLTYTGGGIPCGLLWTTSTTTRRYFQATFSTTGYKNIIVHSNMYAYNQFYYPGQKLQYSTDGTNFTDLATCTLMPSAWVNLQTTLPQALEDQTIVYLRWIADETTTPVGSGNDGTGMSNIYVFADEIATYDPVKPTLISTIPANGSTGASANGSISLTFDKNVKAGTGNCTLGSTVLTPIFGSKTVTYNYTKLDYNTQYTFTIPEGALTNVDGVAFGDTTITFTTMNRPVPTAKLFDAVVAKDGSGDYTSITAAISAAPTGRVSPWLIFVKNGTYTGHVDIPSTKPYIHMIGQQRDSVIISDSRLCGAYQDSTVYPVNTGATVVVNSSDCYFENITFENKFGYVNKSGPQALALYTWNDRIVLNNCWLRSFQDTYLTSYGRVADRHYIKNCRIEGAVDFIYGGGDVFFDKCTIYCTRSTGGYIVAPSHQAGTAWGYVFSNCIIDGPSSSYTTYLGRPWTNSPKASFFNTTAKINIYPVGWYDHMNAIPAIFADYNTMDADGNLTDMSARISKYWYISGTDTIKGTAKNSFTSAEAATYTLKNVLTGSDGWDPLVIVETTENPANVINTAGTITWDATSYAICYIVLRDDKVIGFTTTPTFTDNAYSTSATYSIIAAAESGALSSATVATNSGGGTGVDTESTQKVNAYFNNNKLIIDNIEAGSTISVYSFTGMLLAKQTATSNTLSLSVNTSCIVKIDAKNKINAMKVIK